MNRKILYATLFLLSLTVRTTYAGDLLDGGPKLNGPAEQQEHRNITGEVDRIDGDMIFLKTEEGTIRNFGIKDAKKEGLKGLKPGDRVTLELDEGNAIADIHKEEMVATGDQNEMTATEGKGGPSHEQHRSVVGTVEAFDPIKKNITLKTEEGKSESFEIKSSAIPKLNGIVNGTKVTLEVDEQNLVMDAHQG